MRNDRYGNPLSTVSDPARDAYIEAVDLLLSAGIGGEAAFDRALSHDANFALAHLGKARALHVSGYGRQARAALASARENSAGLNAWENGQLLVLGHAIEGRSDAAYDVARAQLVETPRDALTAAASLGVFGLIGFSGRAGREAENLALAEQLAPSYGDDWWFQGQLAFAQMEAGQLAPAAISVEKSIAAKPRNANTAHYRAHLYYELGETEAGYNYLTEWQKDYPKEGILHCHIAWHIALWALAKDDVETMWKVADRDVDPAGALGPPLNVLTDIAALLHRAEIAGVTVPPERWQRVSAYASKFFPKTGLGFADIHAALAHAMAGNSDALAIIISDAKGPAADTVRLLANAFQAIAAGEWASGTAHLSQAMFDHARIGGSRAQRDLIEFALANTLLKQGKSDEAERLLSMHRPLVSAPNFGADTV